MAAARLLVPADCGTAGEAHAAEGQADWGDLGAIVGEYWNPGGFDDVTG